MDSAQPVVIGVDVGGPKILIGAVNASGGIIEQQRYPMDRTNQNTTLDSIYTAIEDFMKSVRKDVRPVAMGVGLVGHTDPVNGMWLHAMNVPVQVPVPLAAQLSDTYDLPVALDNDVHAATLAELHLGAGRDATDFVYLNVGTGLAAGIVCNEQLVRGAANYAGELGHMVVEPGGDLCQCGQRGCLEPIASGGGILEQVDARRSDYPRSMLSRPEQAGTLTAGDVFTAADTGDELAVAIVARVVRGLGTALVNLVNLLNPQAVVYGGGVLVDGWLMERVSAYVAANALPVAHGALSGFFPSQLQTGNVGLLGAATLAWMPTAEDSELGE